MRHLRPTATVTHEAPCPSYAMAHCGLSGKERLKYGLILVVYMCVAVFLSSRDNPWLHSPYVQHVDSAMFFMGGKAWANGLIPYVDFTDSKGPLLWLIHMVAYLISHTSYVGMMLTIAPVMAGALYFSWLTAIRILGDARRAMWAAAAMPVIWFLTLQFIETRAETYAQLPLAYLLYVMVTGMRSPALLTLANAFWSGVCIAALLLIKWSFAAIGGIFVVGALICLIPSRGGFCIKYIGAGIAGIVALCVPFAVYLLSVGAMGGFIHEYFVNTLATTGITGSEKNLLHDFVEHFRDICCADIKILIPVILILAGSLLAFLKFHFRRWLPLCATALMVFVTISTMLWPYYLQIIGFAGICLCSWGIGMVLSCLPGRWANRAVKLWPAALVLFMLPCLRHGLWGSELLRGTYTPNDTELADAAITEWCLKHAISSPRILYADGLDFGLGLTTRALPASKHWFRQFGATPEMEDERAAAEGSKVADILVVAYGRDGDSPERLGYELIYGSESPLMVFSRFCVYARR
ncbi:MAG: hypothetical protein NC187_04560 [Candidatus Amulumruptor caecigallinarius]|nr:hypothetical protein [Candidatus Amulumruptor caecigallinarius]MCM1396743.1 hypothetical protein [Candidatus Amulumruptor caecigallinarius]MCM1453199.1 hypothetical protein [bacterium]